MGLGSVVGVGHAAYESTERDDFYNCVGKGTFGIMSGAAGGAVVCASWPVLLLGVAAGAPIYAYQRIAFSGNKVAARNSPHPDEGRDSQHERQEEQR